MKSVLSLLLVFCLLMSCQKDKKQPQETHSHKEENFDWLLGKWQRTNDKEGQLTYELWKKESNHDYLGHGFVMIENDTVWEEVMELSKNDSGWFLEVKTPGNIDNVIFNMTEKDTVSFTVENPTHDFPKVIAYKVEDEKLKATVLADSLSIEFEFERTQN
ncbi:MAG: hypothetical protein KDD16_02555 [Mangrovimonas sp.]|nr:hypothetical protein [Mangrovimonas sp.]